MTGTEIKTLAESYIDGDIIDNVDGLLWINAWLSDLGTEARKFSEATLMASDSTVWLALPSDFLAVSAIAKDDGNDYEGSYDIRNGTIRISAGTYTLLYYKIPAVMTVLTNTPDAHALLHSSAALYLASRYKSKNDDENQDATRLIREYENTKNKALWQIDNPKQDGSASIINVY